MGQKSRERTKFWLCKAYGLVGVCVCVWGGVCGVKQNTQKPPKGMSLGRGLETGEDLASERKEGIPAGELLRAKILRWGCATCREE